MILVSKKMFNTVYTDIQSHVRSTYSTNLSIIFRPQIQPWHPSSLYCAEVATAVLLLNPEKFWPFSAALYEKQIDFFDVNVINETRNQTYERLAKLASSVGVDESKVLEMVKVGDKPQGDSYNIGNQVTNDVKKMVKANRTLGVHVTPTVVFNGKSSSASC